MKLTDYQRERIDRLICGYFTRDHLFTMEGPMSGEYGIVADPLYHKILGWTGLREDD